MELFHEYYGKVIFFLTNYINTCVLSPEKAITEKRFRSRLNAGKDMIDSDLIDTTLNRSGSPSGNLCAVFQKQDGENDIILPVRSTPIPIRTTEAERTWLKSILTDSDIAKDFFDINDQTRIILNEKLGSAGESCNTASVESGILSDDYIDDRTTLMQGTDIKQKSHALLRKCLQAYERKNLLEITGRDHMGAALDKLQVYPLKLRYNLSTTLFTLIGYDLLSKDIYCINLHDFDTCKTVPLPTGQTFEGLYSIAMNALQATLCKPVTLRISPQKNGFDRATYLFSGFDRSSYRDENKDIIMTINYYAFQHMELITDILFLGPAITVLSPDETVDEIVGIYKEMAKNYK